MLLVCHPKILHKHCLQFLLGVKRAPGETENNAYAIFWGDKQRALWYVWYFLEWSLAEFLHPYNDDLPENRQLFSKRTERKENNVCVQANVFDSLWMFTCWAFDWNNKQTEKPFLLINRRGKAQSSVPTQSCSKASKYFDNWTSPSTQYNISARVFPELSFE